MEAIFQLFSQEELSADRYDIGDPEKFDPGIKGEFPQSLLWHSFAFHGSILAARRLGCQRELTLSPD